MKAVLCYVLLAAVVVAAQSFDAEMDDEALSLYDRDYDDDYDDSSDMWAPDATTTEEESKDLVDAVLAHHVEIKTLARDYVNSTGAEKVVNARRLLSALNVHDRRERILLYPIVARITDMQPEMVREHNELTLALIHVSRGNLANVSVQEELSKATRAALMHINHEERDVLPTVQTYLRKYPRDNRLLARFWYAVKGSGEPLVSELVAAQHITIKALISGYNQARRAHGDKDATTQKMAHKVLAAIRDHARCETNVLYPLAEEVEVSPTFIERLNLAHQRINMLMTALKTQEVGSSLYRATMSKLIAVKLMHIRAENLLLPVVRNYLLAHHTVSTEATVKYLNCELGTTSA